MTVRNKNVVLLFCFFFSLFWGGMLNEIRLQQSTLLDCICSLSSLKLWFAWGEGTLHEIRTRSQLPLVMYICLWIVTIFITEKNSYTSSWELMKFILLCSQKGGKHCQGILSVHSPEESSQSAVLLTLTWGVGSKGSRDVTLCHLRAAMVPSRRGNVCRGGRSPLPNKVN